MSTTSSVRAEWWRPSAGAGLAQAPTDAVPAKDSAVPFVASLLFTSILLLMPEASVPGFGRVRLALLAGVFAVAAHIWTRLAAGRPLARVTREVGLVGALLGWAIVTTPFSRVPDVSIGVLLNDLVKSVGVFWLVSNTVTTLGRLRTMAWALSLTSLPLAALAVAEFHSHQFMLRGQPWTGRIGAAQVLFAKRLSTLESARPADGADYCIWLPATASAAARLLMDDSVDYTITAHNQDGQSSTSIVFGMNTASGMHLGTLQCNFPRASSAASIDFQRWTSIVGEHLLLEVKP